MWVYIVSLIAGLLDLKYRDIPASIVAMGLVLGFLGAHNTEYLVSLGVGIAIYGPWFLAYKKWKQGIAEGDAVMLPVLGAAFWWDLWAQFHIFTNTLVAAAPYAICMLKKDKTKDVPLIWFGFIGIVIYALVGNIVWWVLSL